MRPAHPVQRHGLGLEGGYGRILEFEHAQHVFGRMRGQRLVAGGAAQQRRAVQVEDADQLALADRQVFGQGLDDPAGNPALEDANRLLVGEG